MAVASALGVAGCSGSEAGDGTPPSQTGTRTPDETPSPESTDEMEATETPRETASPTPTRTPTPTPRPAVAAEVAVGAGGAFRFDPDRVTVAAGDTVRWVWAAQGHNVRPGSVPAGADWTGTAGGDGDTFDAGHVYTHGFEVAGTYDYYCAPHRSAGMTGTVVVE